MNYSVELLNPLKLKLVNQFYKKAHYSGKAVRSDTVLVVRSSTEIVAALRLLPIREAFLLRSMCVAPALRKQGIGHLLLEGAVDTLTGIDCYCYPFSHLIAFYSHIDFELVDVSDVPEWVAGPYRRYVEQGRDIVIMRRMTT